MAEEKGPWFGAQYAGACDGCGDSIEEGNSIRADGEGGYECRGCGEPKHWTRPTAANVTRILRHCVQGRCTGSRSTGRGPRRRTSECQWHPLRSSPWQSRVQQTCS